MSVRQAVGLTPCDMIMKGGLSSGVVYPGTVRRLSDTHRFVNVGGASAGAIAAAAAAACEYHRQSGASTKSGGFDRLEQLPTELGQQMLSMLQPAHDLQNLWRFITGEIKRPKPAPERDGWRKYAPVGFRFCLAAVRANPILMFVTAAAAVIGVWLLSTAGAGWFAFGVLAGVIGALLVVGLQTFRFGKAAKNAIEHNNLGICDGHTAVDNSSDVPLTDWIDNLLSECAFGKTGQVLTFGHLWGHGAIHAYRGMDPNSRNPVPSDIFRKREIDLQVMATNMTMGRPIQLPFSDRTFLWCEDCWSNYFPLNTIQRLMHRHDLQPDGKTTVEEIPASKYQCPTHPKRTLRHVPDAPDLPVIVCRACEPQLSAAVQCCAVLHR